MQVNVNFSWWWRWPRWWRSRLWHWHHLESHQICSCSQKKLKKEKKLGKTYRCFKFIAVTKQNSLWSLILLFVCHKGEQGNIDEIYQDSNQLHCKSLCTEKEGEAEYLENISTKRVCAANGTLKHSWLIMNQQTFSKRTKAQKDFLSLHLLSSKSMLVQYGRSFDTTIKWWSFHESLYILQLTLNL